MAIRIYNTLTGKKELFEPVTPGKVRMYVCGPTVYDFSHIGHARSVVVFDVIYRYLMSQGYDVTYVRNFTDIDDKIINRANEVGIDTKTLAEKYIDEFYRDMDALNVQRATMEPRATEHINGILQVITRLMEKGLAYEAGGDIFFRVTKFDGYGKLSGRKLNDMLAGARVEIDDKKENPMDFVLWKSSKPGEPFWESPWGKGRPGWHIECSAMSRHFLGETFDIHGGGKDLIFPHHENEIAQSEGAFGKMFAKYWVHNGFVNINKEKMSKSLGNFLMIKDVIKKFHPEAVRLFLLSNHYRSPIDFSDQIMEEAGNGLDRLYAVMGRLKERIGDNIESKKDGCWERFCQAMDDDFNTAQGIGVLFDTARRINRILDEKTGSLTQDDEEELISAHRDILKIGRILGILTHSPDTYFEQKRTEELEKTSLDEKKIEKLIQDRANARKTKNWDRADQIRQQLEEMNIVLEDRPEGTVWKIKN